MDKMHAGAHDAIKFDLLAKWAWQSRSAPDHDALASGVALGNIGNFIAAAEKSNPRERDWRGVVCVAYDHPILDTKMY